MPAVAGQHEYSVIDGAQLANGALYTYFAVALYNDVQSDPSNLVTITAVNEPTVAGNDSYSIAEDTTLNQASPGVLANDDDPDTDSTLTAALVTGPSHGTLVLNANGSFTYTPAPGYNGPDSFTYKANDGTVDTNIATVAITVTPVNDVPTISDIVDRTIDGNTSTGALSFTIGDEAPATVTASGSSSNTTLVPSVNIVFGGAGAARTVTVTPAPNQSGTATITVTVTDSGGLTSSDSFVLTVRQANYTFVGVQNVPPPSGKTFKTGSAVPMKWQFRNGATVVNSSQVAACGHGAWPPARSGPIRTLTNTDPGSSSFRYDAATEHVAVQPADQGAGRPELSGRTLRGQDNADDGGLHAQPGVPGAVGEIGRARTAAGSNPTRPPPVKRTASRTPAGLNALLSRIARRRAAADFRNEWVFGGLAANREVRAVRFREASCS